MYLLSKRREINFVHVPQIPWPEEIPVLKSDFVLVEILNTKVRIVCVAL
jgi:hypothetical protein